MIVINPPDRFHIGHLLRTIVAAKKEPAKYHSRFYRIRARGDELRLLLLLLAQRLALGRGH